ASLPTFGELRVAQGHVDLRDAASPAKLEARFSLDDSSDRAVSAANAPASGGIAVVAGGAAAASSVPALPEGPIAPGLRLAASGTYKAWPVRINLMTSGVLGLLEGDPQAQPVTLEATLGKAELSFKGSTTDPLHLRGLKGTFSLSGPSLAAVGDPIGVTLPTTPAFSSRGGFFKDGNLYKVVFDSAQIGSSRLNGAFTFDRGRKVPLLAGRLGGSRLVLADLGPAVGAPAVQGGDEKADAAAASRGDRVFPDKKFDLPSLRAMDANVLVDIAMFDPGTSIIEPLRPAHAHLLLADGVLTISDFVGTTAQGRIVGYLQLDGRSDKALWTADLRLLGINLAQFLHLKRAGSAPPYLAGKLDALIKVKGSGRSTAEIFASLNGDIRAHLREASISHLVVEAGGIDIAQALGMLVKGDDALPIQCNVADLDVEKGVIKPKVFVINTRDSTIWVDGTISLRNEGMDLRAVVSPKDFSPLTLRTPIHVRGTLSKPAVSLELGKVAGKVGAAGLLALLNPLAAIVPFIDPGARGEAKKAGEECAALVPTSGRIPAPVRVPATTRVPPAATASAPPRR
ncbi:MAG: AsmA family protein, partial [Pseudomonadota bacterium]|nr:AsmA family protein [Pseudomonadota bacterium]